MEPNPTNLEPLSGPARNFGDVSGRGSCGRGEGLDVGAGAPDRKVKRSPPVLIAGEAPGLNS